MIGSKKEQDDKEPKESLGCARDHNPPNRIQDIKRIGCCHSQYVLDAEIQQDVNHSEHRTEHKSTYDNQCYDL